MNKLVIKMQLTLVDGRVDLYLLRLWYTCSTSDSELKAFWVGENWSSGELWGEEILKGIERVCYRQRKEQRKKTKQQQQKNPPKKQRKEKWDIYLLEALPTEEPGQGLSENIQWNLVSHNKHTNSRFYREEKGSEVFLRVFKNTFRIEMIEEELEYIQFNNL